MLLKARLLALPHSTRPQKLDAVGRGSANGIFGVSAGVTFEAPLITVGCYRVGDPHSEKGLSTDLNEERMRSGAEAWVRTPGRGGGLPCFFLSFLAKCFMTPR